MKYTDIAVIGRDLAGSTAAAMLERAGIATIVVDPHKICPPDLTSKNQPRMRSFRAFETPALPIRCSQGDLEQRGLGRPIRPYADREPASNTASSTARQ